MNWKNINLLTDDDNGKPLLIRSPYDNKRSYVYFCGVVADGRVFQANYADGGVLCNINYLEPLETISTETQYIRIDEIKGLIIKDGEVL